MTIKEKVALEYERGERNPYLIAERVGATVLTVRDYLSRLGLKLGKKSKVYKVCLKTKLIRADLYVGAKTVREICDEYGVSRQYVHKLKKELERDCGR